MFSVPIHKDLVLVGGGHSHIEVLRRFGMKPMPGVRLTLVTRDVHTPYSGMLPGYISGFYSFDDCHIDLERLARYANARLIHAQATGINLQSQEVLFDNRPAIPYDVLSINVGITPAASTVKGAAKYGIPVKPIDRFVAKFDGILEQLRNKKEVYKVVVVGGGPGGVELACALNYRLNNERQLQGIEAPVKVTLISRGPLLGAQAAYARNSFLKIFKDRNIELIEHAAVVEVTCSQVILADKSTMDCDACVWCTQASAAPWFADSGLPVDSEGFIAVNEYLQLDGGPGNVFAAGDASGSKKFPRPKAGVYAVRAGPPLADNIRKTFEGKPLERYIPQGTNLALISAGDKYCIGVKGKWFGAKGGYLWRWKDYIDRTFMNKYSADLDFNMKMMANTPSITPPSFQTAEQLELLSVAKMRCGGCGGKVGSSILGRVLSKLQTEGWMHNPESGGDNSALSSTQQKQVLVGLKAPDDAAVLLPPPPGHVTVHTVDFFKAPIEDPFIFGKIAALHALSDCHAMGATPTAALAIAVVPFAAPSKVEADLYQLMAGAAQALESNGCVLVGGHTSEGSELSLGFSVYGTAPAEKILKKTGLETGQALILTQPLGHGLVMAAAMKGVGKGRYVTNAVEGMVQSNGPAAEVLLKYGATACTDITGFGLLGHAAEMCRASHAVVEINSNDIPVIPGALESAAAGSLSSLHAENAKVASLVINAEEVVRSSIWPLLVDPQTGGGLLASVPAVRAQECVDALKQAGYSGAIIGTVKEIDEHAEKLFDIRM